jgi:Chalcone isomerase-like
MPTGVDFVPQFAVSGSRMRVRNFIAKGLFCCAAALFMTRAQAREVSGVAMPDEVTVAGEKLRLNGMGVRHEMIFFRGYVIALYLEKPTTDAQIAIQTEDTRRLVITMLRNVSREMFVQAIESGIMRNSGAEMPALRARLDLLEHAVPDLKKGDVVDLTWVPGVGTLVRGQGRNMTIPGKDFADALLAVWLGPSPVEAALKRVLLGGK